MILLESELPRVADSPTPLWLLLLLAVLVGAWWGLERWREQKNRRPRRR